MRKGYSNFSSPNSNTHDQSLSYPPMSPRKRTRGSLHMLMHNRTTAPLPCSEQDATVSALMVDVFEAGHEIRDTAQAED